MYALLLVFGLNSSVSLSVLMLILSQVLSISLAALGSLMWLRKNKPKTLIPIIYACAGIVATMPSITRSGLHSSSNWLIFFPQIFILGALSIQRNDYLECHWFKTLLELLIFLLLQIGMSISGRVHTC